MKSLNSGIDYNGVILSLLFYISITMSITKKECQCDQFSFLRLDQALQNRKLYDVVDNTATQSIMKIFKLI